MQSSGTPDTTPAIKYDDSSYIQTTLDRIESKYGYKIIFITQLNKIKDYIKSHAHESRIAFLVREPSFLAHTNHFSPIFFERKVGVEYFLQIDSMGNVAYVLPESETVQRIFYYSPFQRQVNESGCLEDAIKVLIKCFQENALFTFVQQNSIKDLNITQPTSEEDFEKYSKLYYQVQSTGKSQASKEDADFLDSFKKRNAYEKMVEYFKDTAAQSVIKDIYSLTSLPARFLVNIEHKKTLDYFLKHAAEKFDMEYKPGETVGQHIKRKGEIYKSSTEIDNYPSATTQDLREYKGQDFAQRRNRYEMKARKYQIKQINPHATEVEIKDIISNQLAYEEQQRIQTILESFTQNTSVDKIDWRGLLSLNIDMSALKNRDNENPLHYVQYLSPEAIKHFLKHGVDINHADKYGVTPIFNSAYNVFGTIEEIRFLIDNGANPLVISADGNNVLFSALSNGTFEVIKWLADTYPILQDQKDNEGYTVLMRTLGRFNHESFYLFLNQNPDLFASLQSNSSSWGNDRFLGPGSNIFHKASLNGDIEILQALVSKEPKLLNTHDKDGWSALIYVLVSDSNIQKKLTTIKFLLANGINLDIKTTNKKQNIEAGLTAYDLALQIDDKEILNLIQDYKKNHVSKPTSVQSNNNNTLPQVELPSFLQKALKAAMTIAENYATLHPTPGFWHANQPLAQRLKKITTQLLSHPEVENKVLLHQFYDVCKEINNLKKGTLKTAFLNSEPLQGVLSSWEYLNYIKNNNNANENKYS